MGPLKTFLDVILLHQYFLRTISSWRVGPGRVHPSLNGQLQTIKSYSRVTVTKVGDGVQSFLFNDNLWPRKAVTYIRYSVSVSTLSVFFYKEAIHKKNKIPWMINDNMYFINILMLSISTHLTSLTIKERRNSRMQINTKEIRHLHRTSLPKTFHHPHLKLSSLMSPSGGRHCF